MILERDSNGYFPGGSFLSLGSFVFDKFVALSHELSRTEHPWFYNYQFVAFSKFKPLFTGRISYCKSNRIKIHSFDVFGCRMGAISVSITKYDHLLLEAEEHQSLKHIFPKFNENYEATYER